MITRHDLEEAIAECQGQRNPTASTCLKLAAFYTIRKELFGNSEELPVPMQSYAPEPVMNYGDSDFLRAIEGKPIDAVLGVIDELVDSVRVLQPRIYDSVMRRIENIGTG